MATKFPEFFAALAAPFEPEEVKVREQAGRNLRYIKARSVMNRMDLVCGPEGWWDSYEPGEHSVLCKLTIVLPDGTSLTKADAGGYQGMADQGDDDMSGYSNALKRAAVRFGVGRYLYRDGYPDFATNRLVFDGPPAHVPVHDDRRPDREPSRESRPVDTSEVPMSGKALFAKLKVLERQRGDIIRQVNAWGKENGLPDRMVDWPRDAVGDSWVFATGLLDVASAAVPGGREPGAEG